MNILFQADLSRWVAGHFINPRLDPGAPEVHLAIDGVDSLIFQAFSSPTAEQRAKNFTPK
jgi:hypothetical protein